MLPETLLTMVAAVLLCRVAPQIFDRQHAKA
jgi:putative proton-coupled thiamine transporter yuaJ